jgi:ABC-type nitrate/sulfonate/bicarbonate transport system permease component
MNWRCGKKILKNRSLGLIPVIILFFVWVWAARRLDSYLLPSPSQVATTILAMLTSGELLQHLIASLLTLIGGYVLGVTLGITLGMLMGTSPFFENLFDFLVNTTRPIPAIALIPLVVLWLGLGYKASAAIIFFAALYPILLNTFGGVKGVEKKYIEFALTNGARSYQVLWKVIFPAALPQIFVGLRLGMGYGWRAMVGAEMLASQRGLGYLIMDARWLLQTERVITGIIAIGFIGWLLDLFFLMAEKRLVAWREEVVL